MKFIYKAGLGFLSFGISLLLASVFSSVSYRVGLLMCLSAGAVGMMGHKALRSYAFTAWVLVCVGVALAYPQFLQQWGGFSLSLLIVPLVQLIMFGMGTTLSIQDFSGILKAPWPVFVGVILQFGIMPMVGFFIAKMFGFDGELAAGIVLIGSVSGGVASNLMCFIAKANVALSVTMTVISTFAAPFLTPLLMKVFANQFISIDTRAMMIGVLNIVVVPVITGLFAHMVLYSSRTWFKRAWGLMAMAVISAAATIALWLAGSNGLGGLFLFRNSIMLGGVLITMVAMAKLIISVWLGRPNTWMNRVLPLVSMTGICMILAILVAQTHDVLMTAGFMLVLAAVIHNTIGYTVGYWGGRTVGILLGWLGYKLKICKTPETLIDEANCRTIAFEVGMQNGGMATGLAMDVLKSHVAALPSNVFGTWMDISGSMLANWWKKKGVERG